MNFAENEETKGVAFAKAIALPKRELVNFCRVVEPLSKGSTDDYGKVVHFHVSSENEVELTFVSTPYIHKVSVTNQSGKYVKDFTLLISTLKNLLASVANTLVLVEDGEGQMNLAFGDQLIYLQTQNELGYDVFESVVRRNTAYTIDKTGATYTFKTVGSILSQTERASERVTVVKNGMVHFNTGIFAAQVKSPFNGAEEFVIYKQVADTIATIAETVKGELSYSIESMYGTSKLILSGDEGNLYAELPVDVGNRVNEFISDSSQNALAFDANIIVHNEAFAQLVALTKSLDYLSDVVKIDFTTTDMVITLTTVTKVKSFNYKFGIQSGVPTVVNKPSSLSIDVLKILLTIVGGTDINYAFTEQGLGIKNDLGRFLIRRA